jgi:hypothetical protein
MAGDTGHTICGRVSGNGTDSCYGRHRSDDTGKYDEQAYGQLAGLSFK